MPRPLIPPRGVFVPSAVQYDKSIPPAVRDTYSQILGVAYGRPETPPVSFHQLSEDFGKSISTLRGHMAFLRDRGVLRWRTAQDGTIIVSFPKGASKGQAFFRDESADSENLEKPVKEDEDVINLTRKELEPPHPPDSVKRGAKNQKERHFSATVHQALLEAGVFESKLPELAQAGLSDDEIMAIIHKVEDEFGGEQKGGILVHRIQNKVLPAARIFRRALQCLRQIRQTHSQLLAGNARKISLPGLWHGNLYLRWCHRWSVCIVALSAKQPGSTRLG